MGGLRRILGLALLALLAAPVLALGPASVVDRGADGGPRASAFPAALVVLDPLIWRCARNSLAVASAVAVGATALGLALGMALGRRRFWGRRFFGALALAPLAVGPIWLTPGVIAWIGGEAGWDWLAARSFLGQPGDDWARYLALVWVGVAGMAPLALLAARAGLDRVDPAWADAARAVGAGRGRTWRDVTWPTLRPELGRAGGLIFALSLVEPAAPTILGLRRTLAVELAGSAFDGQLDRAATLAALAALLAAAGRWAFARWGGPGPVAAGTGSAATHPVVPRAGTRLGAGLVLVLLAWGAMAVGPAAGFARRLVAGALGDQPPGWAALGRWAEAALTPDLLGWLANSATTAGLAVLLGLLVLATTAGAAGRPGAAGVPPLVLAVGALAMPGLLAAAADLGGWAPLAAGLRAVAAELSPGRAPGFLLVLVLAATRLPALRGGTFASNPPGATGREAAAVDAALLAGATARAARRLARGGGGLVPPRLALVAWAWASTDVASAWALTPLPERRTAATAALALLEGGAGPDDPRLLALFLATTLVRVLGLALLVGPIRRRPGDGWAAAA